MTDEEFEEAMAFLLREEPLLPVHKIIAASLRRWWHVFNRGRFWTWGAHRYVTYSRGWWPTAIRCSCGRRFAGTTPAGEPTSD